jgi:hypothetical protein
MAVFQQGTTGLGQFDAATAGRVKANAELLLQPVQALRETRLAQSHRLGSLAQVQALGRCREELELTVIHKL